MKRDVVVIGAGIHGMSAAYHMARRGLKVVVLERDHVARHASGASAGGVRRLRRKIPELPIAMRSLEIWKDLRRQLGEDASFRVSGHVAMAEDEAAMEQMQTRAAVLAEHGYTFERLVGSREIQKYLPPLGVSLLGGTVVEDDGFVNPPVAVHALRRGAERHGASIVEGAEVVGLDRKPDGWMVRTTVGDFDASYVANCAGGWGNRISAMIGDSVPIRFKASLMTVTARVPRFLKPVVGRSKRSLSLKQMQNGTVVIGGGFHGRPDLEHRTSYVEYNDVIPNVLSAIEVFPNLRGARIIRNWTGLEGHTVDGFPNIGFSASDDRMVHAYGFCGVGFQMGPGVGLVLSDLVANGHTDLPIQKFLPHRFNELVAEKGPDFEYDYPTTGVLR